MKTGKTRFFLELVNKAILEFNQEEVFLLANNVSERCICSKFAMYLDWQIRHSSYDDYVVDVEYNKGNKGLENNPKVLDNKNIVVDLVVHKREYDRVYGFDNLICIEMKKSNDSRGMQGIESDEERLKKLTSYNYGFQYKIGLMIIANLKTKSLEIKSEYYLGWL